MRCKICGITQLAQAQAIASFGVDTLGFICVPTSKRYINPTQIADIVAHLPSQLRTIGVFANAEPELVTSTVIQTGLSGVQLHGDESPTSIKTLRASLPAVEMIKAFRLQGSQDLEKIADYYTCVDTILLDAYHPHLLGGTGHTLAWASLTQFTPPLPWLLAGGLNPDNISQALELLHPDGVDLSSGVERQPGDKDLDKVKQIIAQIFRGEYTPLS